MKSVALGVAVWVGGRGVGVNVSRRGRDVAVGGGVVGVGGMAVAVGGTGVALAAGVAVADIGVAVGGFGVGLGVPTGVGVDATERPSNADGLMCTVSDVDARRSEEVEVDVMDALIEAVCDNVASASDEDLVVPNAWFGGAVTIADVLAAVTRVGGIFAAVLSCWLKAVCDGSPAAGAFCWAIT